MAESQSGDEQKRASKGPLLLKIFAFVNLGLTLGGAVLVYMNTLGYQPPSATDESLAREIAALEENLAQGPVIYTMPAFNTNLAGVPRRLIRVEISLEMLDENGFEEVVQLDAGAKDSIVKILNEKSFDDLETVQGKLKLKNQIVGQVNSYLRNGIVKNVYFSDFVVQ